MTKTKYNFINNLFVYGIFIFISFYSFHSKLYWYIIPISLITTSVLLHTKHITKKDCIDNNINDPYLNLNNSTHTKLCKINPKKFFNFNLYTNHNDIFFNKNLERQFYTMPNVFSPIHNKDLSMWLYNTVDNCKNNSDFCTPYYDTRYH